jgi:O-antigen/teichoic acid export membrane protein
LKKVPLLLVGAGVGFVAFLPFARLTVLYTLGENYLPAVPILVGLIAAAVIFAATIPLAAIMYIDEERSEYFSISTLLMILVQVGGGFLLIPQFGVDAAVGVRVASRVVVFAYTVFAVLSFLRRKYSTVLSKPS